MGQVADVRRRAWARPALAAILLLSAVALGACGGSSEDAGDDQQRVAWTLVLDYEPNAVHAGLLQAQRAGYFREAGIDLEIIAPSSTADALTQVTRGRAQLGLGDLIDVARRNERGIAAVEDGEPTDAAQQVEVVAAVVQEPLSGILVDGSGPIRTPADLAGKRIAVSGLPSDEAVVAAIAGGAAKPETVTLGFGGLKALDGGRVDGTTAYWPADEVTLRGLGTNARRFTLTEFGDIRYPGLVAFTSRRLRVTEPERVQAFAAALRRGTLDVIADASGETGLQAVQGDYPELDADATAAQLKNYAPLFGDRRSAGLADHDDLEAFTAFAERYGLTEERMRVSQLTTLPQATQPPAR